MNDNRLTRFKGRATLRKITSIPRCQACGWIVVSPTGVGIRLKENNAAFAGLATCGRIWVCPVCNDKVMAARRSEVAAALMWAEPKDLHIIGGSLTVRHKSGDSLRELIKIQTAAWRYMVQSRIWSEPTACKAVDHDHNSCPDNCDRKNDYIDSGAPGRVGYIRASEITIGENGWHPHFHPIIFYRGSKRQANDFAQQVVAAWVLAVQRAGGEANIEGGQKLSVIPATKGLSELAGYITKSTYKHTNLALEAVWSQGKSKRERAHATAPHWSLLDSAGQGLADDIELWSELEYATTGHRMITWSRGLRELAGVGVEQTDEQLAAAELGSKEDTVCFITEEGWPLVREQSNLMAEILNTLEQHGWSALRSLLTSNGIPFTVPDFDKTSK